MRNLVSLLSIILAFSVTTHAVADWTYDPLEGNNQIEDPTSTLAESVLKTVAALKGISADQYRRMDAGTYEVLRKNLRVSLKFLRRVANYQIAGRPVPRDERPRIRTEDDRLTYAAMLVETIGETMHKATEPMQDPLPRLRWSDLRGVSFPFPGAKAAYYAGTKVARLFQWLARDAMRASPVGFDGQRPYLRIPDSVPIPFISGRDDRRARLLKELGKDFLDVMEYEAEQLALIPEENRNLMVAEWFAEISEQLALTEPVRHGRVQKAALAAYYILVLPYMFFNPPIDIAGIPERTTYSPMISAIIWTSAATYLAVARRRGAGTSFYNLFQKISHKVEKIKLGDVEPGLIRQAFLNLKGLCAAPKPLEATVNR